MVGSGGGAVGRPGDPDGGNLDGDSGGGGGALAVKGRSGGAAHGSSRLAKVGSDAVEAAASAEGEDADGQSLMETIPKLYAPFPYVPSSS